MRTRGGVWKHPPPPPGLLLLQLEVPLPQKGAAVMDLGALGEGGVGVGTLPLT